MPRFIVLSKLSAQGNRAIKHAHEQLPDLEAEVAKLGGKVLDRFVLLGPHDFFTVVELRDNDTAQLLRVAGRGGETASRQLLPAIDLDLFIRLLGQTTENTGPHKWQISPPARVIRRFFRGHSYLNEAKRYFKPYVVLGAHHFDSVRNPALFVANHSSFADPAALYAALPNRFRGKLAWPAAADRFYIKGRRQPTRQGWWFSLTMNSFPMIRGGGSGALGYSDWLVEKGWSIAIFPEGARTSAHKLARFRAGAAILATRHGLPVVPLFMEGLSDIRPKGTREKTPGPVTVRVGPPLRFTAGGDAKEANRRIFHAVDDLRIEASEARRSARAAAHPQDLGSAAG
jgi:1-acyl-sn-glycerol-3-phosphate acyltransferase